MKEQYCINNFTYRRYTFDYFLESAKRLGVKQIELSGCHPHFSIYEAEQFPVREFAEKIKNAGLTVPVIEPEQNFLPVNIASEQEFLREESIKRLSFYIEHASEFGCSQVIVYPGKGMMDFPLEESRRLACDSMRRLAKIAKENGVTLLLQNVSTCISGLTPDLGAFRAMLDEIDDPSIGVSVNTCAVTGGGNTLEEYFDAFGGRIKVVQLSDSDDEDEQLSVGEGEQDFSAHIRTLEKWRFAGPVALEITMEEYADGAENWYYESMRHLAYI